MSSKHLQFIICSKLLDQMLHFIHIFSMQIQQITNVNNKQSWRVTTTIHQQRLSWNLVT